MSNTLYKPINYFKSERPSDAGQWRGGYPDDKVYNMDFDSASLYVASSQYRQSAVDQNFHLQAEGVIEDRMRISVGVWVQMGDWLEGGAFEYIAQCVDSNGFNGFGIYQLNDTLVAEHIDSAGNKTAKASLQFSPDNLPGMFKYFSFGLWQPGFLAPPAGDLVVYTNTGTMSFGTTPTRMDPNAKRQLTIGADYQGNTPFNGLVHSLAIWNGGYGSGVHRQLYNDGNGYAADLRVPWGEYTRDNVDRLVSWYRLGADSNRTWVDFGPNRINLTEGPAVEDDIVSCAPMGGCLTLETVGAERFRTDPDWVFPFDNDADLNFGNNGKWTILTCTAVRPTGAGDDYLWDISPPGASLNRSLLFVNVLAQTYCTVFSNAGALGKLFTYSSVSPGREYPMLLGQTFDSSELDGASTGLLKLFNNGVEDPAPNKLVNNNCVVDNTDARTIYFNSATGGAALFATQDLYWMAIWDSVLAPEEIRQIYNKGFHSIFKLDEDYGDYVSSSSLVQWYKCGSGNQSTEVTGVWNSNKVLRADGGVGATSGAPTNINLIKNSTSMSGTMDTTPVATLTPLRGGNPGPQIVMTGVGIRQAGTAAAQSLGLSKIWTISTWVSSSSDPGAAVLKLIATLQSAAAPDLNINRVTLGILGGAPDVFQVNIWNHAGALIKSYSFGDNVAAHRSKGMMHVAATFDAEANTLRVYANGMEDTAPAKPTDVNASSQTFTDSARFLYLGGAETLAGTEEGLFGTMGNCLFWDSVLSPNEIRQVYRSGPIFDPFNNRYGYASSRNLIHCYRWDNHDGVTMNSVGEDRVGSYTANLEFTAGMTLNCCLQQGGYGTIIRP